MSERGQQLLQHADSQINELIAALSTADSTRLSLPCPGREKLGDGTVGTVARHTAHNYQRMVALTQPDNRSERRDDEDRHEAPHIGESIDLDGLLDGLRRARGHLDVLADLTERQLDAVPPANTMRFVDGTRTLEQILASMLKHQGHQVDALRTALS